MHVYGFKLDWFLCIMGDLGFIDLTLSAPFITRSFVLVIPINYKYPTKIPRRQTRAFTRGVRSWVLSEIVCQG